jgi:elongation factor G
MQVDSSEKIRNVAVTGHNDTGKTTLVSSLLYTGGVSNRLHRVEDGNTITDFDPEEIERRITIGLSTCYVPWRQHKVNLLDCPGYGIFFTETRAAMRAADSVLLCVSAVSGIEVLTERVWRAASQMKLPLMIHLNKMDRERANFPEVVSSLQESFGREVVPVQLPIGSEGSFEGVVDLVHQKAYRFTRDGNGQGEAAEVPADMADAVESARSELVELVAETDDELMEHFFDAGTLSQEQLEAGLRQAIARRRIFPVTCGSAVHGVGQSALLDSVVDIAPSPLQHLNFPGAQPDGEAMEVETREDGPFAALVFKTLSDPFSGKITFLRVVRGTMPSDTTAWNPRLQDTGKVGHLMVMQGKQGTQVSQLVAGDIGGVAKLKNTSSGDTLTDPSGKVSLDFVPIPEPAMAFAVEPKSKGDEEKIGEAMVRLIDEDPTLHVSRDPETHEYLLSGAGQLHIEITTAKLRKRYNVDVILHAPKVPYRETIRRVADGHGRHKKQSGGRGQFADCKIKMEPLQSGGDFEFVDEIFGGSIPQSYRPAVEKGIQEARMRGYLAGFPVVDFRVRLLDGQYHDVDSSEMAFKIAGSLAFKDAMERAAPTILEPMMKVEVTTTDDYTGDVISDLSQRRGRPSGMDSNNGSTVITAIVPMSEMLDYAPSLRSITQGRAAFHLEFDHYEEVPKNVQDKIIAETKQKAGGAEG